MQLLVQGWKSRFLIFIDLIQIRICNGCGASYSTGYIRQHQLRHCPGRQEDEVEVANDNSNAGHNTDEDDEEDLGELDEIMGEVNEDDQTLLGAGLGVAVEEEEDAALRLQDHLRQQRQQRERTPPGPEADSDDSEDLTRRWRNLRRRVRPRLPSDDDINSIAGHDTEEEDDTRPVIPDPPSPLSLDLSAGK